MKKSLLSLAAALIAAPALLAAAALLAAPASAQLLQKNASVLGQKKEVPAWAQKQLQKGQSLLNGKSLQPAPFALNQPNHLSRAASQRSRTEISYQVNGDEIENCGLVPLFNPGELKKNGFTGYGFGAFFYGDMFSRYTGNTIKSINFAVWPGNYSNIMVFVMDGTTGQALWTTTLDKLQCIDPKTGDLNMNVVPCDYKVTGDEQVVYIGWIANYAPSADDPYASKYEGFLPYYEDNTHTGEGAWINVVDANGNFGPALSAGQLKDKDGNIFYAAAALTIDTEGENGLKDIDSYPVAMSTVRGDMHTGKGGNAAIQLENLGLDSIKSIDYTLSLGAKTVNGTYNFKEAIPFYGASVLKVPAVLSDEVGTDIANFTVTKVNGVDDEMADNDDNVVQGYVYSLDKGYRRMPVVEEFTSNTCGWCPYGIFGLKDVMTACSNNAITIAAHTTFAEKLGEDPLAAETYQPVIKAYANGFPSAMVNREAIEHVLSAPELAWAMSDQVCEADMVLEGAYEESMTGTSVSGKVKLNFSIDSKPNAYGLAYVITEDGVQGVKQLNNLAAQYNYYSSQYDDAAIMEGLGWTQEMIDYAKTGKADKAGNYWSYEPMDHVACYISHPKGSDALLPAAKSGEPIEVDFEFDMPERTSPEINTENLHLAALLFDQQSGVIVTAAQIKLGEETNQSGPSGIETAENAAAANIAVADGAFNITAENAEAQVYNAEGKLVSSCTVNGSASLPTFGKGVYVVRVVSGGKVMTKKAAF